MTGTDEKAARLANRTDAVALVEAARMLRAVVEALPPASPRDRATVRRIEGAAVALEAVSTRSGA